MLARLVLGPWLFAIFVVTASFSASLTSMLTISWSQPSVTTVEMLKEMNATVGCNAESFICNYLKDTLQFESSNIKRMESLDNYPKAFEDDSIKAAFFISPHADVFLLKNCKRYTKGVSSFKLGGIGFVSIIYIIPFKITLKFVHSKLIFKITKIFYFIIGISKGVRSCCQGF